MMRLFPDRLESQHDSAARYVVLTVRGHFVCRPSNRFCDSLLIVFFVLAVLKFYVDQGLSYASQNVLPLALPSHIREPSVPVLTLVEVFHLAWLDYFVWCRDAAKLARMLVFTLLGWRLIA